MSDARTNNSLPMIHAYLDGELNTAEALAFEQRISDEPAFAAERKRLETLHRVLQEKLPRESAPPDLRRRIERSIGVHAINSRPSWRTLAASVALVAVLASRSIWALLHPQRDVGLADAIVSGHVRALMAPQSSDVLSSDRYAVKPWFNGRIPQAPRRGFERSRLQVGRRPDRCSRAGAGAEPALPTPATFDQPHGDSEDRYHSRSDAAYGRRLQYGFLER